MYLVLSAFTSSPVSYLATTKAFDFFFIVYIYIYPSAQYKKIITQKKLKVMSTLYHAMKTQRGSRGIAPLFL